MIWLLVRQLWGMRIARRNRRSRDYAALAEV
jgi:hypothetical protein